MSELLPTDSGSTPTHKRKGGNPYFKSDDTPEQRIARFHAWLDEYSGD